MTAENLSLNGVRWVFLQKEKENELLDDSRFVLKPYDHFRLF